MTPADHPRSLLHYTEFAAALSIEHAAEGLRAAAATLRDEYPGRAKLAAEDAALLDVIRRRWARA